MKNGMQFVPTAPKTYEVRYVENENQEQIKRSPLSPAARSKVIQKRGGNYVSENREGYGPCLESYCNCTKEEINEQIHKLERRRETARSSRQHVFDVEARLNSGSHFTWDGEDKFPWTRSYFDVLCVGSTSQAENYISALYGKRLRVCGNTGAFSAGKDEEGLEVAVSLQKAVNEYNSGKDVIWKSGTISFSK